MRIKLAALILAIASLALLPSSSKADTFEYDYTTQPGGSNGVMGMINVVFTLTAATLPPLLLLGCGLFGLLAMASFGSRIRRFAS